MSQSKDVEPVEEFLKDYELKRSERESFIAKNKINEQKLIELVDSMCSETLPPEYVDMWDQVKECLFNTRKNLRKKID